MLHQVPEEKEAIKGTEREREKKGRKRKRQYDELIEKEREREIMRQTTLRECN